VCRFHVKSPRFVLFPVKKAECGDRVFQRDDTYLSLRAQIISLPSCEFVDMEGIKKVSPDEFQVKSHILSQPFRAVERKRDIAAVERERGQKAQKSEKMVSMDMRNENGTYL
jgi:hypothetical protein